MNAVPTYAEVGEPKKRTLKVHGSFTRGGKQEAKLTFTIPTAIVGGKTVADPRRPVILEARVKHDRTPLRIEFDHVIEALFAREAKARVLANRKK